MKNFRKLCAGLCFFLTAAAVNAKSQLLLPPTSSIPASYFGMHIHRATEGTQWPLVPFGSWRLWDANVGWSSLEKDGKGRWWFGRLDQYVQLADKNNVDLVLTLGLTPAWASARPAEPSNYKPGNAAEPRNIQDWKDYVRTVATRYKGRIHYYEIWNEPNYAGFYSGSVAKMVELTRVAAETLKSVDPAIKVISPPVTGTGRHLLWLDQFLKLGGGQYIDIVGYHFYVPKSKPEAMLPVIAAVRRIADQNKIGSKPIWNTETGWWIANTDGTPETGGVMPDWTRLTPDQGAAYMTRAMLLGWASGVERFYWYSWDHKAMGMIEPSTAEFKPIAEVYKIAANYLIGSRILSCVIDVDGVSYCKIQRQSATTCVAWVSGDIPSVKWTLPATCSDQNLSSKSKSNADVIVTTMPSEVWVKH